MENAKEIQGALTSTFTSFPSTPASGRAVRSPTPARASASSVRGTLVSKTTSSEMMIAVVPSMTVPTHNDVSAIVGAVVTIVWTRVTAIRGKHSTRICGAAAEQQSNCHTHAQHDHSAADHAPRRVVRAKRRPVNGYQCGIGIHFQNLSSVPGIDSGQALESCNRRQAFRCPRKPSRKFHWD